MAPRVCPYWVGCFLLNPLRRLIHNPDKILASHVSSGMTVLDIGPGMGFFTLPLARMVGPGGQVICVDIQENMLSALQRRAQAVHLADRIVTRLCQPTSLGLDDFEGQIDFGLAFAVVHEVPKVPSFFGDIFRVLKPEAYFLVAEPKLHVSVRNFEATLAAARQKGLSSVGRPNITWCHTALLRKD
jgi:ubiquinone/menaquinone biosynthesis C-methylase UbiE